MLESEEPSLPSRFGGDASGWLVMPPSNQPSKVVLGDRLLISKWFTARGQAHLGVQRDSQDCPLLVSDHIFQPLRIPQGPELRNSPHSFKPGSCGHPLVGEGGKLSCSPRPSYPALVWLSGRGRPSLWSGLRVEQPQDNQTAEINVTIALLLLCSNSLFVVLNSIVCII